MRSKIYTFIVCLTASIMWGQNISDVTYGNMKPSTHSNKTKSKLLDEGCNQIVPIPDDLTNGTYIGGNAGMHVAADVPVEQGKMMVINEIKVSLARRSPIHYVHFKFHAERTDGMPGEDLFDVTDTQIIPEDTLTYLNEDLGYLRTLTVKLNTPVVLHGNERQTYWMEVLSDARAWAVTPNAEDVIGKGHAFKRNNHDWTILPL